MSLTIPFEPEGDLERTITAHPDWIEGASYGKPRPGHPEGQVVFHVAEVLANVDRLYASHPDRARLRLIALVHDTFKHKVDRSKQRCGENHHGMIARRFAEGYTQDPVVLDIVELHDDAYNSWQKGSRDGQWFKAEERAHRLLDRLGQNVDLYTAFFECDNATGTKRPDCVIWWRKFIGADNP